MDKCHGILGYLFGHKFKARYSSVDTPPNSKESLETVSSAYAFHQTSMAKNLTKHEQIYQCDVCVRCGLIAIKKERLHLDRAIEL